MRLVLALFLLLLTVPAHAAEPFRDCPDCPDMVMLAPGSVRLGDSMPPIVAVLPAFALGRTEISVAQYGRCVADGACRGHQPRWPEPDMPMTDVTAIDAEDFCAWLSARTGRRYRLPGEAEWEYAAKAGTTTAFPWGEAMEPGRAICQRCDPRFDRRPGPVGSTRPNPWGLFDMNGNVWEWTGDCWGADCGRRAVRGGSWYFVPAQSRSSSRAPQDVRSWSYDIGFRVLREE